jgi:DNA-binding NtrC family response regulator
MVCISGDGIISFEFLKKETWRYDKTLTFGEGRDVAGDKTKIIVVESDPKALKELETTLSPYCLVVGTTRVDRALQLACNERDAKAIAISTAKGIDALGLLNSIRFEHPHLLRILLTSFEDLTQIVEGLHSGTVHRVVSKPVKYAELFGAIRTVDQATHVTHSTPLSE